MINKDIQYLEPTLDADVKRKFKKSVKASAIDTYMYQDSISDIESVRNKLYNNNEKHEFVEQLTEDLFHCLYKVKPEVYNSNDLVPEQKVSHQILKDVIGNQKFSELRNNTVSNLFNSTISLSSVQDQALKIINEFSRKNSDIKSMMDNISKAKKTREKIENNQAQGKDTSALENKLNELLKKIEDGYDKAQFDICDMSDRLSSSVESTLDVVNDINNLLDGFGGSDEPQIMKLPYEDKVKLAKALKDSRKFSDICNGLGRMSDMMNKVGKKASPHGHSVADIGLGNKLSKTLASEKAKLADEDLENHFLKKYINKGLLEFKTEGSEKGKGPIVICLDESGSMRGYREVWSKAFCLACIQIAVKQKRDCKVIPFSSTVRKTFLFEKKKFDANALVDFCEYFMNGGTDFDEPLELALKTIEESQFKKADILFVTDGNPDGPISLQLKDDISRAKSKSGIQVQSVLIGSSVEERFVNVFSDTVIRVSDLSEDGAIIDVFNNIQKK